MSKMRRSVNSRRNRSGTQWKPKGYVKKTSTPKFQREKIGVGPVPAMKDPMKTLGHPARGRKQRRK